MYLAGSEDEEGGRHEAAVVARVESVPRGRQQIRHHRWGPSRSLVAHPGWGTLLRQLQHNRIHLAANSREWNKKARLSRQWNVPARYAKFIKISQIAIIFKCRNVPFVPPRGCPLTLYPSRTFLARAQFRRSSWRPGVARSCCTRIWSGKRWLSCSRELSRSNRSRWSQNRRRCLHCPLGRVRLENKRKTRFFFAQRKLEKYKITVLRKATVTYLIWVCIYILYVNTDPISDNIS